MIKLSFHQGLTVCDSSCRLVQYSFCVCHSQYIFLHVENVAQGAALWGSGLPAKIWTILTFNSCSFTLVWHYNLSILSYWFHSDITQWNNMIFHPNILNTLFYLVNILKNLWPTTSTLTLRPTCYFWNSYHLIPYSLQWRCGIQCDSMQSVIPICTIYYISETIGVQTLTWLKNKK